MPKTRYVIRSAKIAVEDFLYSKAFEMCAAMLLGLSFAGIGNFLYKCATQ